MDSTRDRPSGIPRLSRVPVPRSNIPKPALATSTNPPLRPRHSRDSLGAGELNPPRLRTAASRDHLRSSTSGIDSVGTHERPLRTISSRDQLRPKPQHAGAAKLRADSTPNRNSIVPGSQQRSDTITTRSEADLAAIPDLDTDDAFQPTHAPPRTPESPQCLPRETLDIRGNIHDKGMEEYYDEAAAFQTPSPHETQVRPSLAERTMETLAQIPSSPALNTKSSFFFEQARRVSRAESGSSRPGSSHASNGPGRPSSRRGARPGSSAGQNLPSTPSGRASNASFKNNLSTIGGSPRRTSAIGLAKTPQTRLAPNRATSLTSASKRTVSGMLSVTDVARSPSPNTGSIGKTCFGPGSKTTMKDAAGSTDHMLVSATGWDGDIPHSKGQAAVGANQCATLTNRKSSAALREQVANAKAAKRAATRQTSTAQESTSQDQRHSVPSDELNTGFECEDPFNLRKGEKPGTKVLQQRIASARTTGRLNIAALGLRDMPPEVINMYSLESIGGGHGANWAESVDLTRLVGADNEIERFDDGVFPDKAPDPVDDDVDDDGQGNIFGGLETLDLHGNLLSAVPLGFRRLGHLTSLNLSSNRLGNDSLAIISQITSLRDLRLSKNLLSGPLDAALLNLSALEMIDLHGNNISALPPRMETMSRLGIMNLNENKLEAIPFDSLSKVPLTELSVRKNRLAGALIQQPIESLAYLQTLDASANQLTHLVPEGSKVSLPTVHSVSLSVNRLQSLPDITSWTSLLTLTLDENHITRIPESFTTLQKLRLADFSSNDISVIPPEIARMQGLTMMRLTGNPLRDRKLISASTDELKDILAARLEPPPPYQEPNDDSAMARHTRDGSEMDSKQGDAPGASWVGLHDDDDPRSDPEDDFRTPPTSAPHTPTRARSDTVIRNVWFVKPGGLLDVSKCDMSSLDSHACSAIAAQGQVRQLLLHHNPMAAIPMSLTVFGSSLSFLSLAHARLAGESYLGEALELPALRELCIMSNQVGGLRPLTQFLKAPMLEKLDASLNRIASLPPDLKQAFPRLSVLLVPSNQLTRLEPDSIRGLRIVDASSNDIGQLNPRLGLLGGVDGLQRLDVAGNRFKVPRWGVLEQGTEATLRWLRGRLPAEEMAAWTAANGEEAGGDVE